VRRKKTTRSFFGFDFLSSSFFSLTRGKKLTPLSLLSLSIGSPPPHPPENIKTGETAGAALTAFLGVTATDFTRLPLLVLICAAASVGPALLLPLVRGSGSSGGGEGEGGARGGGAEKRKNSANGGLSSSELIPLKSSDTGDSAV